MTSPINSSSNSNIPSWMTKKATRVGVEKPTSAVLIWKKIGNPTEFFTSTVAAISHKTPFKHDGANHFAFFKKPTYEFTFTSSLINLEKPFEILVQEHQNEKVEKTENATPIIVKVKNFSEVKVSFQSLNEWSDRGGQNHYDLLLDDKVGNVYAAGPVLIFGAKCGSLSECNLFTEDKISSQERKRKDAPNVDTEPSPKHPTSSTSLSQDSEK